VGAVLEARWRSAANAGSVSLRADGGGSTHTCSLSFENVSCVRFGPVSVP